MLALDDIMIKGNDRVRVVYTRATIQLHRNCKIAVEMQLVRYNVTDSQLVSNCDAVAFFEQNEEVIKLV